jgi:hypothetical protein
LKNHIEYWKIILSLEIVILVRLCLERFAYFLKSQFIICKYMCIIYTHTFEVLMPFILIPSAMKRRQIKISRSTGKDCCTDFALRVKNLDWIVLQNFPFQKCVSLNIFCSECLMLFSFKSEYFNIWLVQFNYLMA